MSRTLIKQSHDPTDVYIKQHKVEIAKKDKTYTVFRLYYITRESLSVWHVC